jgi:hypothetical protein
VNPLERRKKFNDWVDDLECRMALSVFEVSPKDVQGQLSEGTGIKSIDVKESIHCTGRWVVSVNGKPVFWYDGADAWKNATARAGELAREI